MWPKIDNLISKQRSGINEFSLDIDTVNDSALSLDTTGTKYDSLHDLQFSPLSARFLAESGPVPA